MIRELVCNQCQQVVREDELFVHLVTKHNWKAARQDYPLIRASAPKKNASHQAHNLPPRLGPMSPSLSSVNFMPSQCKYCGCQISVGKLEQHQASCSKKNEKLETIIKQHSSVADHVAEERTNCPYCGFNLTKRCLNKHIKKHHQYQAKLARDGEPSLTIKKDAKNTKDADFYLAEERSGSVSQALAVSSRPHKLNIKEAKKPKVELVSSRGMKVMGLAKCQQCKVNHIEHWVYRFSDGSTKKLCRFCKGRLLDKVKNRKTDAMNYRVPGSAMSGKNSR